MMKTPIVILIFNSLWIFPQTKEELDNVMLSKDEYKIVNFIKRYPNNPNVTFLKKKLESIKSNNISLAYQNLVSLKNRIKELPKSKENVYPIVPLKTSSINNLGKVNSMINPAENDPISILQKKNTSNRMYPANKTETIINHLFNNDPTNPEAFLQIQNQSNCDIKVKIEGKNVYYLDVPSMGENFLLVPKGKYNISTQMCKVQYSSLKDLSKDMMIKLVGNKNARN